MTATQVKLSNLSDYALKAEIELKATPERVYAAWTKVEPFARWFGPRANGHLDITEFDCSVGGHYDVTMVFDDGDRFQITGQYLELDPPKKIVLTWQAVSSASMPEPTLVTVTLCPTETGTWLTLTHERFISTEIRDLHAEGWSSAAIKLAASLTD